MFERYYILKKCANGIGKLTISLLFLVSLLPLLPSKGKGKDKEKEEDDGRK